MAVVKIIELVGSSKTSTDDAAKQALLQAQGTLRNIRAVDIVSTGIRGENLDEYRAHVRVAFLIERGKAVIEWKRAGWKRQTRTKRPKTISPEPAEAFWRRRACFFTAFFAAGLMSAAIACRG